MAEERHKAQYTGKAPYNGQLVNSHCITLDGVDDYVRIPHDDALTFGDGVNNSPFSISGWIYMHNSTNNYCIVAKIENDDRQFYFGISNSGNPRFTIYDSGNNSKILDGDTTLNKNQWYYIVGGYSDSDERYIKAYDTDFNLVSSNTTNVLRIMDGASNYLTIGVAEFGSIQYANAKIFDVRVHNTELTEEQIKNVFQGKLSDNEVLHIPFSEGAGLTAFDISGNENHGTINAIEADFWANTQDVYHHNVVEGFDKWGYSNTNADVVNLASTISLSGAFEIKFTFLFKENDVYPFGAGVSNLCKIQDTTTIRLKINGSTNDFTLPVTLTENEVYNVIITRDGSNNLSLSINGQDSVSNQSQAGVLEINTIFNLDTSGTYEGPRYIKSLEITGEGKWTAANNWQDELGSNNGTPTSGVSTTKLPSISSSQTLSNPSGNYFNGAETEWLPNPKGVPAMIRHLNIDETTTRKDFVVEDNEFLNYDNPDKIKNYLSYTSELTAAEEEIVFNRVVKWNPLYLGDKLKTWLDFSDEESLALKNGDIRAIVDKKSNVTTIYNSKNQDISNLSLIGLTRELTTFQDESVYKITLNSGEFGHHIRLQSLTIGKIYKIDFKFYLPSTNAIIESVIINTHSAYEHILTSSLKDEWITVSWFNPTIGSELRIQTYDINDNKIFTGNGTDYFYIKDFKIIEYTGNHFIQQTSTDQPLWNSDGYAEFDGVSEYLENTSFVSELYGYTDSEIISKIASNSVAATIFGMGQSGSVQRFIQYVTAQKYLSTYVNTYFERTGSSIVASNDNIFSNKDALYINNIEEMYSVTGSNWIPDLSDPPDRMRIGGQPDVTPTYDEISIKQLLITSEKLTPAERAQLNKYLNYK